MSTTPTPLPSETMTHKYRFGDLQACLSSEGFVFIRDGKQNAVILDKAEAHALHHWLKDALELL